VKSVAHLTGEPTAQAASAPPPLCARGFSTASNRDEISLKVSKRMKGRKPSGKPYAKGDGRKRGSGAKRRDGVLDPQGRYRFPFLCTNCDKTWYGAITTRGDFCSYKCRSESIQKVNRTRVFAGELVGTGVMRRVLMDTNPSCKECGILEWQGKPIALQLHHHDGDPSNNVISNCWLLCPNCHSQTHNYAGKAVSRETPKTTKRALYLRGYYKNRRAARLVEN
jgi:5-methylcytosine-specific restriction endonuclease McrA